jgi:hypothetical protein
VEKARVRNSQLEKSSTRIAVHERRLVMRIRVVAASLAALLSTVSVTRGDVELANGNRVEGHLKQVDPKSVVIAVGGQLLTLERDRVRAIFFGKLPEKLPPQPASPGASSEALRALQGLRSMIASGPQPSYTYEWAYGGGKLPVSSAQYEPRVIDAQIIVDRYLHESGGDPTAKKAMSDSMYFYALGGAAMKRNEDNRRERFGILATEIDQGDVLFEGCPHVKKFFADYEAEGGKPTHRKYNNYGDDLGVCERQPCGRGEASGSSATIGGRRADVATRGDAVLTGQRCEVRTLPASR